MKRHHGSLCSRLSVDDMSVLRCPLIPLCHPLRSTTKSFGVQVMQSTSRRGEMSMINSVFGKPKAKPTSAPPAKPDIIPPDYKLPAAFFLGGVGLCLNDNLGAGVPMALIGAFLASRAQKVRFVFDKEALEVSHAMHASSLITLIWMMGLGLIGNDAIGMGRL